MYMLALGIFLLAGQAWASQQTGRLNVFVGIPPQAYFVERVGGEYVDVSVLVGPGQSPHAYEPTPKQMARLSEADVYCRIGLPFEERLFQKISGTMQKTLIVDTRKGIQLRPVDAVDEHDREQGSFDPHIWLSPRLILIQAGTICDSLCAKDPDHAALYREKLKTFKAELERLDADLGKKLAPFTGRDIFVFHPAFGYFADTYGLKQVAIETAGKEPGSKSLAAVVDRARKQGVKVIFAERQFSPKSASAVALQVGADVMTLDPLGRDCFQNLTSIADAVVSALTREGKQ